MIWTNENDRLILSSLGLADLEHFWNIETSAVGVEYKHLSEKASKCGKSHRRTSCIRAKGARYYIKRACGDFCAPIKKEFDILAPLASLGVCTPVLAAHHFDSASKKMLLLYKNLTGYHSLKKLYDGNASPDAMADFQVRKRSIVREVLEMRDKINSAGLIYRAWDRSHVFVKYKSSGVAILDLEHLDKISDLSFMLSNPVSFAFIRWLEWRQFRRLLGSRVYTRALLRQIASEGVRPPCT